MGAKVPHKTKKSDGSYWYLHTNGSLIRKNALGINDPCSYFESDLVLMWWHVESKDDAVAMLHYVKRNFRGAFVNTYQIRDMEASLNITSADYFRHAVVVAAGECHEKE